MCPVVFIASSPERWELLAVVFIALLAVPNAFLSKEALEYWTPEVRKSAARRYALKRLGTPQDIANVVVFLASDRCNFVTGQVWSVSGGYTMIG